MSDTIETIQITDTARLRVVVDTDATCPRGDWHMLTGFVKVPGRGDSRRSDVPAVHDDPIGIADAQSRIERERDVVRWARIFHGLHLEYDNEHGGYWFVMLDGPEMFTDNWPELALGKPEHLAKQAEVIEQERETYRQWADGEAVGVILEHKVRWVRVDENDEPVFLVDGDLARETWEEEGSTWGSYLDTEYTAQQVALEHFELDEDEVAALRPRPRVGQWAWSRDGLNPPPVAEVSEDGKQIRLDIYGHITDWVPAYNYHFKDAA